MKTRVLITTSTFPRWEGDTVPPFVYFLALELSEWFEVHVLAPHTEGAATRETFGTVEVHRYRYAPQRFEALAYEGGMLGNVRKRPMLALFLPFFVFMQWFSIVKLHKRYGFAALHAHWIIPQGLVAAFVGVPTLVTSHGADLFALKGCMLTRLKKIVLQRASRVSVVSRAMKMECEHLGAVPEKISIQPMGVHVSTVFQYQAGDCDQRDLDVLFVGRLVEKKGASYLVQAVEELVKSSVALSVCIVGDGPERAELEHRARSAGLEGVVSFVDAMPNDQLPPVYQSAKICVMPSVVTSEGDQEGLGLVAVEAMASGCAVVASDLPALRDVVTPGVDGVLVAPEDPSAIAAAISRILADERYRLALSTEAAHSARRFDWPLVGAGYRDTLKEVMQSA